MNDKLIIDNISFEITDRMGYKILTCTEPGFDTLNMTIGFIKQHDSFLSQLSSVGSFQEQGYAIYKADSTALMEEARQFWAQYSLAHTSNDFYFISTSIGIPAIYIPVTFLKAVNDKLQELINTSSVVPAPWLFREQSLQPFPCGDPAYQGVEQSLVITLEAKVSKFVPDSPSDSLRHQFEEQLKTIGLLSNQYNEEKLYWLNQWQCPVLYNFYADAYPVIPPPETEKHIDANELYYLEGEIEELESLKSGKNGGSEPEITAMRRVVLLNLDLAGLLSYNDFFIDASLSEFPWVKTYYDAIIGMKQYYKSAERKDALPSSSVPEIKDGPISIEHFLQENEAGKRIDFYFLATCENIFANTAMTENGHIFTEINGKRIDILIKYDDGLKPKIISCKVLD